MKDRRSWLTQNRWLWALALVLGLGATGCNTVEFHEKRAFGSRVMNMELDPTLPHFEQKVFYSIEGAAGGIGSSAGGGCGCY